MDIDLDDVVKLMIAAGTVVSLLGGLYGYFKKESQSETTEGVEVRLEETKIALTGKETRALALLATNRNREAVVLERYGMRLAGNRVQVHPGEPLEKVAFPVRLEPGAAVSLAFDRDRLGGLLRGMGKHGWVKLAGFFVDAEGTELKSGAARVRA